MLPARHDDDVDGTNYSWYTWNKIKNWKSEEESRPSRRQHCKDRLKTQMSFGDRSRLLITQIPV